MSELQGVRYGPGLDLTGKDDSDPDAAAGSWKWTGRLGLEGIHGLPGAPGHDPAPAEAPVGGPPIG